MKNKVNLNYPEVLELLDKFIDTQIDSIKEVIYMEIIKKYLNKYDNLISKKIYPNIKK